jgi:hypothetical protein
MTGGFLKASSALAIVAAAGLFVGTTNVRAADLGGDCCADLEERIAELEATTVRHANRKISLTISGAITEAVIYWDDGKDDDFNVIIPDSAGAGFKFAGEGKIDADRSVGFVMALNVRQGDPGDARRGNPAVKVSDGLQNYATGENISVDAEYVYMKSASLGAVSLGYRNDAYKSFNNGAFDLGGASGINDYLGGSIDLAAGLNVRTGAGGFAGGWYGVFDNIGGSAHMNVRYDSPSVAGFSLSASWGADDIGAVGVAYSGKFSDTDFTAGIAYRNSTSGLNNTSDERVTMGASLYNAPSGLYLTGEYNTAYGDATPTDAKTYFIKAGWRKNVNGLGETNLYGSYLNSQDITVGVDGAAYTLGLAQDLDAVGATLFLQGDNRQVTEGETILCGATGCEDLTTVVAGMKVTF